MTGAEIQRYVAIGAAILQGKSGAQVIGDAFETWLLALVTEHGAEQAMAIAVKGGGNFAWYLQRRLGIAVTEADQASFADKRTPPAG